MDKSLRKHILFICTGNVCRSPMAEGIFRFLSKHRQELTCESAGLAAYPGFPASPNALKVARKYGVDITSHLSKNISEEILKNADYVFAMTSTHLQVIKEQFPEYSKRVYILKEFAQTDDGSFSPDVDDPIGQDEIVYELCFIELEKAIKGVLEKI